MKAKNPTGRLDIFAAALVERYVEHRQSPVLSAVYAQVKDPLEKELRRSLGPRNRRLRNLPKYIERGNQMLRQVEARG